jgi:hypothetical protein
VPDWADKLPQVVDFMFNQAHPSQEGIQRPQSPTELWNRFVDKFGDDPGVALSWNSETSKGISPQANATGVARVITSPKGGSVGPTVTAGLKHDRNNFQRIPNTEGGDVPVAVSSTRTSVSVTGAISHARTGHVINESTDWGLAVPIMGITAEWNLGGGVGVARLGRTRDGLVSPGLSHREFIFREPKRLIEYANLHRAEWEAALVAQDPTKSTTPEIARERFNTFIEQIASAPPRADRLHGELMTLDPIVADQINNYEARFNALLGKGDAAASSRELTDSTRAECNRLQNEIHRLLKEDSSWKHAGIYGVEISQKNSEKGINFGLKAVGKEDASSARLTALLIAGLPKE